MHVSRQFLRFAAVGATGTAVQYAVLWLGVTLLDSSKALASAVGFVLGSIVNYTFNYFFTFESGKSHVETATKYCLVIGTYFFINTGLMALLADYLRWNTWLAQILVTGIGLLWNFAGSRWWAFKTSKE